MSKKLLSLVLAAVMLVSMFAFTVSAAGEVADGYKIGFYVESNAYVGMPAGEEVIFKFYYSVPDDLDLDTYRHNYGNVAVAYNSAAYTLNAAKTLNASDARTWGSSYEEFYSTTSKVPANNTNSNKVIGCITTNDTEYTLDKGFYVQQVAEGSTYYTSTGYTIDPECEVFSISFTTNKVIEASDVICVPQDTYGDDKYTQFRYLNTETLEVITYDAADVDFSKNVAVPFTKAAEPTVEIVGTMGQMKDWYSEYNAKTNPFNGGLVGRISNLPLTFPNGVCAEISHIYVTVKNAKGEESTKEAYTLYPQDNGTYLFRGVVTGMDINNSTDTIQYKFTVELTTGGTLETEYSNPVSGASIYTAAKTNFDAANA